MAMIAFERKQALYAAEFDRYVIEHPEFAAQIPKGAQIVIEVEGDEEFNSWARSMAERQHEKKQAVIRVKTKGLMPAHSRLVSPVIEKFG
jgi:hypothetical protein